MARSGRTFWSTARSAGRALVRFGTGIPSWILKALYIAIIATFIDRLWLSRQPWYTDMPMTGYAYQQKLLQERFEDAGKQSKLVLFDVSQTFPSSERGLVDGPSTSDPGSERTDNLVGLGQLLVDISRYRPALIAIDWQIAPSDSELGAKGTSRFSEGHTALFKDISEIVASGVPVVFGADWSHRRLGTKDWLPVSGLENYAATLTIPEPSVGPYHAGGKTIPRLGLPPLAVKVAELLAGSSNAYRRGSWPGVSTMLSEGKDGFEASYWINYEAVPSIIREAFAVASGNGNNEIPALDNPAVGESLRGRIVLIGDLRDRSPSDFASFPISSRCSDNPRTYLGDLMAGAAVDSIQEARALRNQMALTSGAGVLHQASAIHTLTMRPIRSLSSRWSEFAFAVLWGTIWGGIGELAAFLIIRRLGLVRETAFAEMHLLALDFVLATGLASVVLMWLSGLTHLHTVIVPMVPAMVMATIAEAVLNMCYAVYLLRRKARRPQYS